MPGIAMGDIAAHIRNNPDPRGSIDTVIESVISAFRGVNSAADRDAVIADLEAQKGELIDSVFSHVGFTGRRSPRDPSETHTEDVLMHPDERAARAEALGNPALPRDASGHKVHPADALSFDGRIPADRTAASYGGGASVQRSAGDLATDDRARVPAQVAQQGDARARYQAAAEKGLAKIRADEVSRAENGPVT